MPPSEEPKYLQIEELSEKELVECDAFMESQGISNEVVHRDPSGAIQRYRNSLEECVNLNHFNKAWIYYRLGTFYLKEGRLDELVSVNLRAVSEYPADPRAYYCLGTIYYGISQYSKLDSTKESAEALLSRPDFKYWPMEMQENVRQTYEYEKNNSQLIKAYRESKLAASPEEAARLARQYFIMTLKFNISDKDKQIVQTHIRIIDGSK